MNILETLISGLMAVGGPTDVALYEAHLTTAFRKGNCLTFAYEARTRLRDLGKEAWFKDVVITLAGGKRIPATNHRFVCWADKWEEYCADYLYPYKTTWESRKISAGVLN